MTATKRHDGSVTRNINEILQKQVEFYEKLYTKDDTVQFKYSNAPVQILPEQKIMLDQTLSLEEFSNALKDMKADRLPGISGITADFMKVFWGRLKVIVYDAFMKSIELKKLFNSARRGVITLLPKSNRDLLLVKHWRLISLLEVDYKIYSKVLSNRMKVTLETIIAQDQSGFLKGRNISHNIRRVLDIMDYTRANDIQALLITIDFEKAFDRVNYESLYKTLEYFGYGCQFIDYVKLLFTEFSLCTINAGYLSRWWVPSRGLFQGNPLGPYLFLTIVKTLAIKLRENPEIEGITINGVKYLLSQFADDMDMFIKFKKEHWEATIKTLSVFKESSGMKINYDKTTVYRMDLLGVPTPSFIQVKKYTGQMKG